MLRNFTSKAGMAFLALTPSLALAADHVDAPGVIADPTADLTDVFAWMDPAGGKMNLILNIPSAGAGSAFSDAVQYVFHVESMAGYGMAGETTNIICTFDASQMVSCWVGDQAYVNGDASNPSGLASTDGSIKVFTGRRNDPFFFNLSGFDATIETVVAAAGSLTFDDAGCPALDMPTSTALVTQLQTEPGGMPALDDFAGGEVLSLVVQVDVALVNSGGPVAAVWASTRR